MSYVCRIGTEAGQLPDDADATITVTWPPILEHDVWETMQSIVAANGTGRIDKETVTRQICAALGITNVDEVLEALEEQDAEEEAKAAAAPPQPANPPAAAPEPDAGAKESLREVVGAIRALRDALLVAG